MSRILQDYCDQCPILSNGENLCLEEHRVPEIKAKALSDDFSTFHCHKTLSKDKKMCYGVAKFLKEQGRPNILMRLERF